MKTITHYDSNGNVKEIICPVFLPDSNIQIDREDDDLPESMKPIGIKFPDGRVYGHFC